MADLVIRLKKESVEGIPESLLHYAADNDFNQVFYYARNSGYAEKALQLLTDADALSAFCDGRYNDWKEYQLFSRYISEQTVDEGDCRRVAFPSACFGNCPYREQCPAHKGKRTSTFVLSLSSINRAKTQRMMSGEGGADYARFRNGVETLPSRLRRNYHTDKPPRGRLRGKMFLDSKLLH